MQGTLKAVSKFGGLKVGEKDDWINVSKGAKETIMGDLDQIKAWKGQEVKLKMDGDNYTQVKLVDSQPKKGLKRDRDLLSYCLSYAKDLCVAGKIELSEIKKVTDDFYKILTA